MYQCVDLLLLVNRWNEASLKRLIFHQRMQCCWTVEAAPWITFLVRSSGVALCWKSKVYWCLMEVPARSFLVIAIIIILIWCWPRIHDSLLYYTSMQRHLTSDCGWPASSFHSSYWIWTMTCLHTNLQVSVCIFLVLNLISQIHFFISICTLPHIKKTKKLWTVIKKYIVFYSLQLCVT